MLARAFVRSSKLISLLRRVHARVLYIDIDIHHGDGVQEAFYSSNRVLAVSFHKCVSLASLGDAHAHLATSRRYSADFFPGTGHLDEIGHDLGKHFSLNIPLQDGIDDQSYVSLFKAIMEPTIATFQPSSIVLQCGADSLGCDRLGVFNLSIAAHGECVRFIKSFNLPLLVLGGGGYTSTSPLRSLTHLGAHPSPRTVKNVSRCWAYETAVLLDEHVALPNALPHTAYDDFFAPEWKLHPPLSDGRNRIENLNTRKGLERIRVGVLERLRYMHGAPSVGMQEIPPGLAPWMKEEDEAEDEEGAADGREDSHKANSEWFNGDRDREGDIAMSSGAFGLGGREKRAAAISATSALSTGAATDWGEKDPPPRMSASARPSASSSTSNLTPGAVASAALASAAANKKRRKVSTSSTSAAAGGLARKGRVVLDGTAMAMPPPPPPPKGSVRLDEGGPEDEMGGGIDG